MKALTMIYYTFTSKSVPCKYLRRAMDWRNHWFESICCTSIILVRWSLIATLLWLYMLCVFDYNNRAWIHLAIYYCDCRASLYGENRLEVHVTPIYILVLKQVMCVLCVTYELPILNTQHCPIKYPIYKNLLIRERKRKYILVLLPNLAGIICMYLFVATRGHKLIFGYNQENI